MLRRVFPVLVLVTACSSTDDPPQEADGLCGPGPYVELSAVVYPFNDAAARVAGLTLTSDLCPEEQFVSDESGAVSLPTTLGAIENLRAEAPGYLPVRTGEHALDADLDAGMTWLIPEAFAWLLPSWSWGRPTMLVRVLPGELAGEGCDGVDGVTVSVTGHPEAVVLYATGEEAGYPEIDPTLTATGPSGFAEVSGVEATAPGELVELVAEKEGCEELSFASYPHTGGYVLENGVLTVAAAFMHPLAAP